MKEQAIVSERPSTGLARVRVLAIGLAAKILYAGILMVVMPGILGEAGRSVAGWMVLALGVAAGPLVTMFLLRGRLLYAGAFMLGEAACLAVLPAAAGTAWQVPLLGALVTLWLSSGLLLGVQLVHEVSADEDEQLAELVEVMVPALFGGVLAAALAVTSDEVGHQVALVAAALCGLMVLGVRSPGDGLAAPAQAHE